MNKNILNQIAQRRQNIQLYIIIRGVSLVVKIQIILNRRGLGHRERHSSFTAVWSNELRYDKKN